MSNEYEFDETLEDHVGFELVQMTVKQWALPGDTAEFVFQRLNSVLYVDVTKANDDDLLCHYFSSSVLDSEGNDYEIMTTNFRSPVKLASVESIEADAIDRIIYEIEAWMQEIDKFKKMLSPANWTALSGRRVDDELFAKLAQLFVYLEITGSTKVTQRCAEIMDVGYETAKSRIRFARSRGLLSKPGHGNSSNSTLTTKAKKILETK